MIKWGMTNTVNNFTGAVFMVSEEDNPVEIADSVASGYFPDTEYHFTLTNATPVSLPDEIQEQMATHQRNSERATQILTVYPWPAKDSTLPERSLHG